MTTPCDHQPVGIIARDDVIRALARLARAHRAAADREVAHRLPQMAPN